MRTTTAAATNPARVPLGERRFRIVYWAGKGNFNLVLWDRRSILNNEVLDGFASAVAAVLRREPYASDPNYRYHPRWLSVSSSEHSVTTVVGAFDELSAQFAHDVSAEIATKLDSAFVDEHDSFASSHSRRLGRLRRTRIPAA